MPDFTGGNQRIMEKLRRSISGLCLPRYVLDTPGEMGKIPLGPFREYEKFV